MFFAIRRVQQSAEQVNAGVANPVTPGGVMELRTTRTLADTAIYRVHSAKVAAEYLDLATGKPIPRRAWSADMQALADSRVASAPPRPFAFRLTVLGWIAAVLVVAVLGLLVYQSVKPDETSPQVTAMEQAPEVGDVYFGSYEIAPGTPGHEGTPPVGFGWFKVVAIDGDVLQVAKGVDMSPSYVPKEQLGSAEFESEATSVRVVEQLGATMKWESVDGSITFDLSDKQ